MPEPQPPTDFEGVDIDQVDDALRERDSEKAPPKAHEHADDFDPGSPAADAPATF